MSRGIADPARRAAAVALDALVVAVPVTVITIVLFAVGGERAVVPVTVVTVLLSVAWGVACAVMQGRSGASIGMRALGLHLEDTSTTAPVGPARALLRFGAFVLASVPMAVSVFFDRTGRSRGWHDKLVNAVMTAHGTREKVMPVLPARPPHAAEWLEAMSASVPVESPTKSDPTDTDTVIVRRGGATGFASPPPVVATVVWDDGSMTTVATRTMFGRNPTPGGEGDVVAVEDPTLSLSKTHFEITPTSSGGAEITDLHSTNGVTVRRDGTSALLTAGTPLALRSGDIVEIGPRRARVEVGA